MRVHDLPRGRLLAPWGENRELGPGWGEFGEALALNGGMGRFRKKIHYMVVGIDRGSNSVLVSTSLLHAQCQFAATQRVTD